MQYFLQYLQPSLSYHLSLISLMCLFLSGRLRPVLLYMQMVLIHRLAHKISFNQESVTGMLLKFDLFSPENETKVTET